MLRQSLLILTRILLAAGAAAAADKPFPAHRVVGNVCYPSIAADFARTFAVLKKLPCLIWLVWLVQHAGFPGQGGKAQEAFRQAALESFGK